MNLAPIIYAPGSHTKQELLLAADTLASKWLVHHEIKPYRLRVKPGKHKWCGYWSNDRVTIFIDECRTPAPTPGFAWSWPGYKADLSTAGVVAHEVGHHVWFALQDLVGPRAWKQHVLCWTKAALLEPCVTSYEPNVSECFAEAFKVFLLNPDLLAAGRPMRYELLTQMGCEPAHTADWRTVLQYGHPKRLAAAESWIKRGN